ncbi:MAG: DNA repair protein RadA [Bacteroidia bacterium]|nr:DNA repair protein RadA [Bacteroidia bacterium]
MGKHKTIFICSNCGAHSAQWLGKCPSCNEWNTFVEEIIQKQPITSITGSTKGYASPISISEIIPHAETRIITGINELDRVLGGGLVPGAVVLIGGEPGIGKSTLLLQLALKINEKIVLYITGEESPQQIKLRAGRIGTENNNCFILSETSLENIFDHLEKIQPGIIIVDSVQTLYTDKIESSPGSVTQVRECTMALLKYAKKFGIPVFLIGHINKEGNLAGPKVLEHIVDTVLLFEGDPNYMYRVIRVTKNRFGSTSELAIFEMRSNGLKEVSNPSEVLISNLNRDSSGTVVCSTLNGNRILLVEIQSLVSSSVYGTPQRVSTGFDYRRLNMLLAVLEKRAGFRLSLKDVFINIAGGLRIEDPGLDLAVICAILSSDKDFPIDNNFCFAGEVGLSGEIRPVYRIEQRIAEAQKLGFKKIFISKSNIKGLNQTKFNIEISGVSKIEDLFRHLL